MSRTLAALAATLIATGMTSAVSHEFTLLGGCGAAMLFAMLALFNQDSRIYPTFLFGAIALSAIALISSEANTADFSSTIHVLSCYLALVGLAFSSSNLSAFCQQFMMSSNLLLTAWILYHGYNVETIAAWQITNPSGAGNLMATQINMTLPLVLSRATQSSGFVKFVYLMLLMLNCVAVLLMMSRNGIGSMLIVMTLYILFNNKRMAVTFIAVICAAVAYSDSIMRMPFVFDLLIKLRLVNFVPKAPRSVIWQISIDHIFANKLLGVGPGEPRKFLSVLDIYHAHNNIIQVAFETGLPSAAILALMVALLLWLPCRMSFSSRQNFVRTLPIVAYMTFAWTGAPLALPGATLFLVACVNEARVAMYHSKDHNSVPPWRAECHSNSERSCE